MNRRIPKPVSLKAQLRLRSTGDRLLRAHIPEIVAWLDAGWSVDIDGLLQPKCASMMLPFQGHILKAPPIS